MGFKGRFIAWQPQEIGVSLDDFTPMTTGPCSESYILDTAIGFSPEKHEPSFSFNSSRPNRWSNCEVSLLWVTSRYLSIVVDIKSAASIYKQNHMVSSVQSIPDPQLIGEKRQRHKPVQVLEIILRRGLIQSQPRTRASPTWFSVLEC